MSISCVSGNSVVEIRVLSEIGASVRALGFSVTRSLVFSTGADVLGLATGTMGRIFNGGRVGGGRVSTIGTGDVGCVSGGILLDGNCGGSVFLGSWTSTAGEWVSIVGG